MPTNVFGHNFESLAERLTRKRLSFIGIQPTFPIVNYHKHVLCEVPFRLACGKETLTSVWLVFQFLLKEARFQYSTNIFTK